MDNKEIEEIAREMSEAYIDNDMMGNATKKVKDKFPTASLDMLRAMWKAIDAYVDVNVKFVVSKNKT